MVSTRTYSPSVSREVLWKINTSPVTGFSMLCPVRIISLSPWIQLGVQLLSACAIRAGRETRRTRVFATGGPSLRVTGNRTGLRFGRDDDDRNGDAHDCSPVAGRRRARRGRNGISGRGSRLLASDLVG